MRLLPSAVVLLVDRSGSMDRTPAAESGPQTESVSSPLDTAFDAARALAALLGPDDSYGLIAFDTAPHVLRPLAAVRLEHSPSEPTVEPAGGTDWGAALGTALLLAGLPAYYWSRSRR